MNQRKSPEYYILLSKYIATGIIIPVISLIACALLKVNIVENIILTLLFSIFSSLIALGYDILNLPESFKRDKDLLGEISKPDNFREIVENLTVKMNEIWSSRDSDFGLTFEHSIEKINNCYAMICDTYNSRTINLTLDEPLEMTTECFIRATKTVFATSLANEKSGKIWTQERMKTYLSENKKAVERGIKVDRFFVFKSTQDLEYFKEILKKQLQIKSPKSKGCFKLFVIHEREINLRGTIDPIIIDGVEYPVADFSMYDDKVISTWESFGSGNKIDKSKLEWHETAKKNAKIIKSYFMKDGRSQEILLTDSNDPSKDNIDDIIKNWKQIDSNPP